MYQNPKFGKKKQALYCYGKLSIWKRIQKEAAVYEAQAHGGESKQKQSTIDNINN